jgi:biopolymer transport protein ExbD
MRIRLRPTRRRTDAIRTNLTTMIDVTFLLLIYFMVSMVFEPNEDNLNPTLQTEREAASGAATDFEPQIIEVLPLDGAPAYRIGARVLRSRADLVAAVDGLPRSVGVFVNVSSGVEVAFAAQAIQVVRDAGFEQVTYVPAE